MPKNHWTAYWQTGVLTSLPMDFKENYDGELAAYWQDILKKAHSPIRILDVCTGNGAIAILLQELAERLSVEVSITAVDAAKINPRKISELLPAKKNYIKKINFIGGCLVEQMLSKIDQKFDLIVSQYGIEYCDIDLAAPVVSQLLNKSGRLVFISHAAETDIHKFMREEEGVYQHLEEMGAMHAFKHFGEEKITANGFKRKLNDVLAQMKLKTELQGHALFRVWVNAAVQLSTMNNVGIKAQRMEIKNFYLQYHHARTRAFDMLAVSDKIMKQPGWFMAFEKYGLKLSDRGEILYKGKHNAGHFYEFEKTL